MIQPERLRIFNVHDTYPYDRNPTPFHSPKVNHHTRHSSGQGEISRRCSEPGSSRLGPSYRPAPNTPRDLNSLELDDPFLTPVDLLRLPFLRLARLSPDVVALFPKERLLPHIYR